MHFIPVPIRSNFWSKSHRSKWACICNELIFTKVNKCKSQNVFCASWSPIEIDRSKNSTTAMVIRPDIRILFVIQMTWLVFVVCTVHASIIDEPHIRTVQHHRLSAMRYNILHRRLCNDYVLAWKTHVFQRSHVPPRPFVCLCTYIYALICRRRDGLRYIAIESYKWWSMH